ncbi:hypothetical protein ACE6H2_018256 [Prunus campanulata]
MVSCYVNKNLEWEESVKRDVLRRITTLQDLETKMVDNTRLETKCIENIRSFVICRATITHLDTHNGWWYKACPSCYKQLRTISHTDQLVCPKHYTKDQAPFPWFSVGLILEDASDETNAMIIVKAAEHLLGISYCHLVVEKGFTSQEEFPDAILRVRGQYKLYDSNC